MPAFRFEFVKAIGNTITNVKLPEGQEANAKTIKHVAGNGPIYIRAINKIELNDQERVSETMAQNV